MSEDAPELPSDRSTAAERVPIMEQHEQAAGRAAERDELPPRAEVVRDISLNRRQSRTIAPPRKWRKIGLRQIVCPECRAIVGGVGDGFWHLQTAHGQGQGIDLEAWGQELRDELDEYIAAARGRRGLIAEPGQRRFHLGGALVGLAVLAAIWAVILVIRLTGGG